MGLSNASVFFLVWYAILVISVIFHKQITRLIYGDPFDMSSKFNQLSTGTQNQAKKYYFGYLKFFGMGKYVDKGKLAMGNFKSDQSRALLIFLIIATCALTVFAYFTFFVKGLSLFK